MKREYKNKIKNIDKKILKYMQKEMYRNKKEMIEDIPFIKIYNPFDIIDVDEIILIRLKIALNEPFFRKKLIY